MKYLPNATLLEREGFLFTLSKAPSKLLRSLELHRSYMNKNHVFPPLKLAVFICSNILSNYEAAQTIEGSKLLTIVITLPS